MRTRALIALALAAGVPFPTALVAQVPARGTATPSWPARAIRRDIPLTDMIRRALAAGTRDSTGRPGRNYWQLRVDYTIEARLDPATSIVSGRETAVIHNRSDTSLAAIQLRLDQNLFAPNVPRDDVVPEITDGMKLSSLSVNGEAVDMRPPRRTRGAPPPTGPYATGLSLTTARVQLARPIPANDSATLRVEWSFRVAQSDTMRGLRMGRWGDSLYQVAQWYPRVAVYDDLGGWDTEPYLGNSEFFNNYGRFDVRIDVPAGWIVGATGVLRNPREVLASAAIDRLARVLDSDSTRTIVGAAERGPGRSTAAGERLVWHFVADTANDFAWATSDRFVWDATRATIPGRGPVPVHVLYMPSHAAAYAPAGPVARHALEFYSTLWMPYAFPQLTVVDGPEGGMEYPMFIMSSTGAADHETGHQWWPMMVGVNETWYGWMDEGFNQYMNRLSRFDREGRAPDLDGLGQSYGSVSGDESEAPLMWNANYGGPSYGFQAYGKAPMMLSMLGGVVGDSAVWRAMSDYARAWRFRHPSPWDFMFSMNRSLGRDLGWFWYSWLFTTERVDGSIAGVRTTGARTTVTVRQDGQMPSPIVLEVTLARSGPRPRLPANATLADSNTVVLTWPVEVWFDGRRSYDAVVDLGGRKIERITLDPHKRFPDRNPGDNVWPR